MNPSGKLAPYSGAVNPAPRVRPAGALAGGPGDLAARSLRQSETSFFARVKRWLGMGTARPAAPDTLLASLRPPSTGRLSFFFGRLSGLSASQMTAARGHHNALHELAGAGTPPRGGPGSVPQALRDCLGLNASRKPDELFDAVCGLWSRGPGRQAPAADFQQATHAYLLAASSHEEVVTAFEAILRQKRPGQSAAQLQARAQAAYAALVGSVSLEQSRAEAQARAEAEAAAAVRPALVDPTPAAVLPTDPIDALAKRLADLEMQPKSPGSFQERVDAAVALGASLRQRAPGEAGTPRLSGLSSRFDTQCDGLRLEALEYLQSTCDTYLAGAPDRGGKTTAAAQARVDQLHRLMSALGDSSTASRSEFDSLAARLQVHLDFATRLEGLEAQAPGPENFQQRIADLAALQALKRQPLLAGEATPCLADLSTRFAALRNGLRADTHSYLETACNDFLDMRLESAARKATNVQAHLDELRQAADTLLEWPAADRSACDAVAVRLQEHLDSVAQSAGVLAHYRGVTDLDPGTGRPAFACASMAAGLRSAKVSQYHATQLQIDAICSHADESEQASLLAALGRGSLNGDDEFAPGLIRDLFEGQPHAVDPILRGAQWDDFATSLRRAAVARREQAALAVAKSDQDRRDIAERFGKERFALEVMQQRRVLNTEINRLIALKDPLRSDLLGMSGAMTGASESAIKEIRKFAPELDKQFDVLLVNWIYCSCLDPVHLTINEERVKVLWKELKGDRAQVPELDAARQLLDQGFRSLAAVTDLGKRMQRFSALMADAGALAAASQAQDVTLQAHGLVRELHARVTGQAGTDPGDPAFAAQLGTQLEAARQAWIQDSGPNANLLLSASRRRNELIQHLQGERWKFDLSPDHHLRSRLEGSAASQVKELEQLVRCLALVEHIELAKREGAKAKEIGNLVLRLESLAGQLEHFDPVRREVTRGKGPAPGYAALRALAPYKASIEALLNATATIDALRAALADRLQSQPLRAMVEALVRVAVLEEAVAKTHEKTPTPPSSDNILKRLAEFGLSMDDAIPVVSSLLAQVPAKATSMPQSLPELCKRLDPLSPGAKGVLQEVIPGAMVRPKSPLARLHGQQKADAWRQRLQNLAAVTDRFKRLSEGESFDIHVGQTGEFTIGQPIVPGVTGSAGLRATQTNGIRVSCLPGAQPGIVRYEVDLVRTKSAALTGVLSLLGGSVTASAQRGQRAGEGYRLSCDGRPEALELVESLVSGHPVDPTQWRGKVSQLRTRGHQTGGTVSAQVNVALPVGGTLLELGAQIAKSQGQASEIENSAQLLQIERFREVRAWAASAQASALGGRLSADKEVGAQVTVERTRARRGGLLRAPPTMTLQSQVVGDDMDASLRRLLPRLSPEDMAHYRDQLREAMAAAPGDTVQVEVDCVMTGDAMVQANKQYRFVQEHRHHLRPGITGTTQAPAHELVEQTRAAADSLQQDDRSYVVKSVNVRVQSSAQATKGTIAQYQATAQVDTEGRRALTPSPSGKVEGQLLVEPATA